MKKIKNLKVTLFDQFAFGTYFLVVMVGAIVLNEIYQHQLAGMLLDKFKAIEFEQPVAEVIKDKYRVHMLKGEVNVLITSTEEVISKQLDLDAVVKSGDTILTMAKSFIVLRYGANEKSFMKIGPNSKVELTYEMGEGEREQKGFYNQITEIALQFGSILLDIKDKYKKDTFKLVTPNAVMGVRGTKFLASSGGNKPFAVAVKEGQVHFSNLISYKAQELIENQAFIVFDSGRQKQIPPTQLLPDWDVFNMDRDILDGEVLAAIKEPEAQTSEVQKAKAAKKLHGVDMTVVLENLANRMTLLWKNYLLEINSLDKQREIHENRITRLTADNQRREKLLEDKKTSINDDLACLQDNSKRTCALKNTDLLRQRGYPKIIFTEKSRQGMFDTLVKYMKENKEKIAKNKELIAENQNAINILKARISKAEEYHGKMTKYDVKKQPGESIRFYKQATKDLQFSKLNKDIKNIEMLFIDEQTN